MNKKGFTLIELLVVIAIIAILAAVIIAATGSARTSAKDSRRAADLDELRTALEMYNNKEGQYPAGVTSPEALTDDSGAGDKLTEKGVIQAIPEDPTNSGKHRYFYCSDSAGDDFALTVQMEADDAKPLDSDYDGSTGPASTCNCDEGDTNGRYCVVSP